MEAATKAFEDALSRGDAALVVRKQHELQVVDRDEEARAPPDLPELRPISLISTRSP